jgi:hypothetical protein
MRSAAVRVHVSPAQVHDLLMTNGPVNHARNVRHDLLGTPAPIVVSNELLRRRTFLPARSLDVLAAAWIQFPVHDWVDHRRYWLSDPNARTIDLPVPGGGTWRNVVGGPPEAGSS